MTTPRTGGGAPCPCLRLDPEQDAHCSAWVAGEVRVPYPSHSALRIELLAAYCVDMPPAPYVLRAAPGVDEPWSTVRLPYEPRDWVLEMWNDVRRARRDSAPRSGWAPRC